METGIHVKEHSRRLSIKEFFRPKETIKRNTVDNPKDAYDLLVEILTEYEKMDIAKTQKGTVIERSTTPVRKQSTRKKSIVVVQSLDNASKFFVFYLLNLTLDEFYSCYHKFYRQFDADNNLRVEHPEFDAILDFFCRTENMGKAKVCKSFEVCNPEEYERSRKVAMMNPTARDRLEPNLKKGMFAILRAQATKIGTKSVSSYVNYFKFLPVLISYFAEYIKQKTQNRILNMELICGLSTDKQRLPKGPASFLEKLESLGCFYKGDENPTLVTFKVLEKALILFRNSYSTTFEKEQLESVLKEIREKIGITQNSKTDTKQFKLTYKFLNWIAYRICLHSALYNLVNKRKKDSKPPKYKILEEYTLWAAASGLDFFDKKSIARRFMEYAENDDYKSMSLNIDNLESHPAILKLLRGFLRTILPHLSGHTIKRIFDQVVAHVANSPTDDLIVTLSELIYDLIIEAANNKLQEFITTVHKTLKSQRNAKKLFGTGVNGGGAGTVGELTDRHARDHHHRSSKDHHDRSSRDHHDTSREPKLDLSKRESLTRKCSIMSNELDCSSGESSPSENVSPGSGSQSWSRSQSRSRSRSQISSSAMLRKLNRRMSVVSNSLIAIDIKRLVEDENKEEFEGLNLTGNWSPKEEGSGSGSDHSRADSDMRSETSYSYNQLDVLVEPTIPKHRNRSRKPSLKLDVENVNTQIRQTLESPGLSKFSPSDNGKGPKRESTKGPREKYGGKGPLIDLSLVSVEPSNGYCVVKRDSLNRVGSAALDKTVEEDNSLNLSTGRKPDFMKSCFIAGDFLEKFAERRSYNASKSPISGQDKTKVGAYQSEGTAPSYLSGKEKMNDSPAIQPSTAGNKRVSRQAYNKRSIHAERQASPERRIMHELTSPSVRRAAKCDLEAERARIREYRKQRAYKNDDFSLAEDKVDVEFDQFLKKNLQVLENERITFKKKNLAQKSKRENNLCGTASCAIF